VSVLFVVLWVWVFVLFLMRMMVLEVGTEEVVSIALVQVVMIVEIVMGMENGLDQPEAGQLSLKLWVVVER
jgi:hypothetical protein